MVSIQDLNLARKWRPKTFDTIVGQDVSVRMLKNSLYLNKFFPVYLFAGQRGCGKTSSARVFAAAVNCQRLATFQADSSSQSVPCLSCSSCLAMVQGNHPDFIEVDAASNTGVDNVRQIIDTSSYMPLVGQKKVYLIDEAHMLSKAAFNALLKLLEEPPATVIFILATTEIQKIPQTVLSRCFQVVFSPINHQSLRRHLQDLCAQEQVNIESEALDAIIQETEGSARDAINLLERVRFSGDVITQKVVFHVLGKMTYTELIILFEQCVEGNVVGVIQKLNELDFVQRSPQMLWDMLVHVCRCLLWIKYGVKKLPLAFENYQQELEVLAKKVSINRLNAMLQLLWEQEDLFLKTNKKHLFFEMVLMQLCQQVNLVDIQDLLKTSLERMPQLPVRRQDVGQPQQAYEPMKKLEKVQENSCTTSLSTKENKYEHVPATEDNQLLAKWKIVVDRIASGAADQFLLSILAQACPQLYDEAQGVLTLGLVNNTAFLRDKIEESRSLWGSIVNDVFAGCNDIAYVQISGTQSSQTPRVAAAKAVSEVQAPVYAASATRNVHNSSGESGSKPEYISNADRKQWPQASLLLSHFPGKLKKVNKL